MNIRTALVTGASGFIGKHLVAKLLNSGVKVKALVRSNQDSKNDKLVYFKGDVFNKSVLLQASNDVDAVFHLVAKTHDFSKSPETNREYFSINVDGTKNLLTACAGSKIKHFIYFSSVKALAEESDKKISESSSPSPTTPYGKSKLEAENLVQSFGSGYGFKTTSLRLPLVYGPGNKGNIYKMIHAINRNRFLMIGKGDSKRSMVSVDNVTDAAIAVANQERADKKTYVITDGVDYSIRELYEVIAKGLCKKSLPFSLPVSIASILALGGDLLGFISRKPAPFDSESLRRLVNSFTIESGLIGKDLGFNPKYTLFNSIDKTIDWYRQERVKL